MDGEVVHTLFSLFYERIAEHFPGEIFGNATGLIQSLINRNGTNWHRRVTNNPLTRFMNMLTSRKIHDGVCTPPNRPNHFLNLFINGGGHCRVTQIAINFHTEVTTNNHRF